MYVVVSDEEIENLLQQTETNGLLSGVSLDNGSVIRLLGPIHSHGELHPVGRWQKIEKMPIATNLADTATEVLQQHGLLAMGELFCLLDITGKNCHFFRVEADGTLAEQEYERLALFADYRSRLQGLFDSQVLAKCTVGIVGLGTGGSVAAAELAKAGVGRFKLADFDHLEVHNLARHVCGMRDLGRYKTDAMRDYLINTSPLVQVETFNFDITSDDELLHNFVKDCDLVIGATDSEAAKSYLNKVAWERRIPSVYGAAYDRGIGGDVFQVVPPMTACYECFRNATADIFNAEPRPDVEDYGKTKAQPALGLDVSFPALIMARAALSILLARSEDTVSELAPYPANWVIWGNQPVEGWIDFDAPLQSRYIEIETDPYCPICQRENYFAQKLNMNAVEIENAAKKLLQNLPSAPEE